MTQKRPIDDIKWIINPVSLIQSKAEREEEKKQIEK